MKIVIEYVLLENMLINLVSLKSTASITKERGRLFLLSAFFGACITVVLPLFRLTSIGAFLVEIGCGFVYICLSFKFKTLKKFLRLFLSFYVVTFFYGGACFFVERYFGIESSIVVLLLVIVLYYILNKLIKKITKKHKVDNFCYDVEIENLGMSSSWTGFLDSGNLLVDPLTQSPVILINFKVFHNLFKDLDVVDVLTRSHKLNSIKMAHYINFNTLNNEDKILVFQVDRIKMGDKYFENPILGLSLKNFNQAFGTDIILHNSCAF